MPDKSVQMVDKLNELQDKIVRLLDNSMQLLDKMNEQQDKSWSVR
ncbi:hypothetical protein ACTHO0_17455 [Cytobacillus praedii]